MNNEFVSDFNATVFLLKENYRSAKKVLQAADKIMPNSNDIQNTIKEGIFEIIAVENEDSEANWISDKINELIRIKKFDDIEGIVTPEKIVVLARNKYVFSSLEKVLEKNKIPYYFKVTPGSIKYESDIMKVFDLALKVKLNPLDSLHFERLKKIINVDGENNLSILSKNSIVKIYEELLQLVLDLKEDGSNFKISIEKFLNFINDISVDIDYNEKNMVSKDIKELQKHWYNYASKSEKKSLSNFKNSMALGQTHPLAQVNGITLSTVHTMKGQEYDIVFLMGMDDETFPDYRAIKANGVDMTQEKNNLYVAFTRSKRFLYVTWPMQRLMPWGDLKKRKISRFLKPFENEF